MANAQPGVRTLLRHSNAVLPLSAEVFTHFIPADAPFFEAVNHAQVLARQTFERLFWMFYFTNASSAVAQDLGMTLGLIDGHLLAMGWGRVPRKDGVIEAMDEAINHPDIGLGKFQNADFAQILTHNNMSVRVMNSLIDAVKELHPQGIMDFALGHQFFDGQKNDCAVTILMRKNDTQT